MCFTKTGVSVTQVSFHARIGNTTDNTARLQILRIRIGRFHLPTCKTCEVVVFIAELRSKDKGVLGVELEVLALAVARKVYTAVNVPAVTGQRSRIITLLSICESVHVNLTVVVQLCRSFVLAQKLVLYLELRVDSIRTFAIPREASYCHRVTVGNHVAEVVGRLSVLNRAGSTGSREHLHILVSPVVTLVNRVVVIVVNRHVRHCVVCLVEKTVNVVLLVVGVRK